VEAYVPEDECDKFLRNISIISTDYMALYPRRKSRDSAVDIAAGYGLDD
jgi:hypothetical protein